MVSLFKTNWKGTTLLWVGITVERWKVGSVWRHHPLTIPSAETLSLVYRNTLFFRRDSSPITPTNHLKKREKLVWLGTRKDRPSVRVRRFMRPFKTKLFACVRKSLSVSPFAETTSVWLREGRVLHFWESTRCITLVVNTNEYVKGFSCIEGNTSKVYALHEGERLGLRSSRQTGRDPDRSSSSNRPEYSVKRQPETKGPVNLSQVNNRVSRRSILFLSRKDLRTGTLILYPLPSTFDLPPPHPVWVPVPSPQGKGSFPRLRRDILHVVGGLWNGKPTYGPWVR